MAEREGLAALRFGPVRPMPDGIACSPYGLAEPKGSHPSLIVESAEPLGLFKIGGEGGIRTPGALRLG